MQYYVCFRELPGSYEAEIKTKSGSLIGFYYRPTLEELAARVAIVIRNHKGFSNEAKPVSEETKKYL